MSKNWLTEAIKKVNPKDDIAIIENPEASRYLDNLLIHNYWPTIRQSLKKTGFNYEPTKNPKPELELSYKLSRSLMFMLFDANIMFYRGTFSVRADGWMLHNDFYLSLTSECNPKVVFEILGNSRFAGYQPELRIDKVPEDFYQITLSAGKGASWGYYDDSHIKKQIQKAISTSTEMYEFAMDGLLDEESIGEFLTMAYEVYESN